MAATNGTRLSKDVGSSESKDAELPEGWIRGESKRYPGEYFYYDPIDKFSQWFLPTFPAGQRPKEIVLSQILIKHKESPIPQSWRTDKIVISREDALATTYKLRDMIVEEKQTFAQVARERSDCHRSQFGGDLGKIWLGMLHEDVEGAAFNLRIGELSQPLESPEGWFLFLRTA